MWSNKLGFTDVHYSQAREQYSTLGQQLSGAELGAGESTVPNSKDTGHHVKATRLQPLHKN